MPKRRAAPADNSGAAEPDIEQPAKRIRKGAAAETVQPFPQPISHPSHLKVAVRRHLSKCSCSGAPSISFKLSVAQVPGDVFMLGTGDCGQFGLGEDVTEALRPNPSPLPGKKVSCSKTALETVINTNNNLHCQVWCLALSAVDVSMLPLQFSCVCLQDPLHHAVQHGI